ncbi:hypothetical protein ACFQVC_10360 [Streptomyces monticola]|uniref:Septum formation-related domain-containing protein n=1 Tax=Streptomyces monticola TaxID=2666263 RepID=A0ABW2JF09_9ACTN
MVLVVAVVMGAIAAVVLVATGGGGGGDDSGEPDSRRPPARTSDEPTPTPSLSLPSDGPTRNLPSERPTGRPSGLESPAPGEVPYFTLKAGDCFDIGDSRQGHATKRSCTRPHDAEVVKMAELNGSFADDAALKKAAADLCRAPLDRKATAQPPGSVRGTLVQYPDKSGYDVGIDSVACSLAANSAADGSRKLTKPLV